MSNVQTLWELHLIAKVKREHVQPVENKQACKKQNVE